MNADALQAQATFRCRLCGSDELRLHRSHGHDGQHRFFKCRNCGLVNCDPAAGVAFERSERTDVDPSEDRDPLNLDCDRSFRFLSGYLSPPGRLLDVGCGNGRFMFVARKAGWDVKGLEQSPEAAKRLRVRLGAAVVVADFMQVGADAIDAVRFDLVCMRFQLERRPDCVLAMAKLRALLAPEGHILIELPNGSSVATALRRFAERRGRHRPETNSDLAIGDANEFSPSALRFLLQKTGFELVRLETYSGGPVVDFICKRLPVGNYIRALVRKLRS